MDKSEVIIEKLIDAPVDLLWPIWTKPEYVKIWFGSDPNGTVLSADINLSVGSQYSISFQDSDQTIHTAFGEYLELTEPYKLCCTWEWQNEPGHISDIHLQFIPENGKTLLILKHANLNQNSLHGYFDGWNATLDKIVELIIKKS